MSGTSTKVQARTLVATDDGRHSGTPPTALDACTREQLEERIRQLEAELMNSSSAANSQCPKSDKTRQKLSHRTKIHNPAPPTPARLPGDHKRVGKFCYNCGEDSHMLPQCSNPTNAILVQKKLCERHSAGQSQCSMAQRQNSPQSNLPLNQ